MKIYLYNLKLTGNILNNMENNIKSGTEILDEFFHNLGELKNVDPKIAELLKDLYLEGALTESRVKNGLEVLRNDNNSDDEDKVFTIKKF